MASSGTRWARLSRGFPRRARDGPVGRGAIHPRRPARQQDLGGAARQRHQLDGGRRRSALPRRQHRRLRLDGGELPGGDGSTYRIYTRNMHAGEDPAGGRGQRRPGHGRHVQRRGLRERTLRRFTMAGATGCPGPTRRSSRPGSGDLKKAEDDPRLEGRRRQLGRQGHRATVAIGEWSLRRLPVERVEPSGRERHGHFHLRARPRRGKTILVSRTTGGDPATGRIYGQPLSSDGNRVTFYSKDGGLPGGDGATNHVYVRNLEKHRTCDRNSSGQIANASSGDSSISGNGRFVAFDSDATNLPGHSPISQSYLRDLKTGKTKLVSQ